LILKPLCLFAILFFLCVFPPERSGSRHPLLSGPGFGLVGFRFYSELSFSFQGNFSWFLSSLFTVSVCSSAPSLMFQFLHQGEKRQLSKGSSTIREIPVETSIPFPPCIVLLPDSLRVFFSNLYLIFTGGV